MKVKRYNLHKLRQIEKLKFNWNSYGAKEFDKEYIKYIRKLIQIIDEELQPEIFPLADGHIQFEWSLKYIYIEIVILSDKHELSLFYQIHEEEDNESSIKIQLSNINEINYLIKLILSDKSNREYIEPPKPRIVSAKNGKLTIKDID